MKKNSFILFLAACFLLGSCKKETFNEPVTGHVVSKKLLQSSMYGNTVLSYNADGTLKKIDVTTASYVYRKEFSYAPGKVSYMTWIGSLKDQVGEYTIVNGKATAYVWTYFAANGDPIATYNESFVYNANGLLEKRTYGNGDYTTFNYDSKGNLILSTAFTQGQASSKIEYTYTNQPDRFPAYGFFYTWGEGFVLPPMSKFLPVTQKKTDLVTAQVSYEGTLNYDLDADGYVLKGNWHSISGGYADWEWTNTFQ